MAANHRKTVFIGVFIAVAIALASTVGSAQSLAAATREYKRLVNLGVALRKIPFARQDRPPHKAFIKKNAKDIVYSEPAGEWMVRSNRYWDLQKKYKDLSIADQIAWTAAENSLPGECEGYVPCTLSVVRMTYGEYLKLYPKGTYSRKALQQVVGSLTYIVDDLTSANRSYEGPTEKSEREEFAKAINELRAIVTRVSHPEKAKALTQIKQIEDAFK